MDATIFLYKVTTLNWGVRFIENFSHVTSSWINAASEDEMSDELDFMDYDSDEYL